MGFGAPNQCYFLRAKGIELNIIHTIIVLAYISKLCGTCHKCSLIYNCFPIQPQILSKKGLTCGI